MQFKHKTFLHLPQRIASNIYHEKCKQQKDIVIKAFGTMGGNLV